MATIFRMVATDDSGSLTGASKAVDNRWANAITDLQGMADNRTQMRSTVETNGYTLVDLNSNARNLSIDIEIDTGNAVQNSSLFNYWEDIIAFMTTFEGYRGRIEFGIGRPIGEWVCKSVRWRMANPSNRARGWVGQNEIDPIRFIFTLTFLSTEATIPLQPKPTGG